MSALDHYLNYGRAEGRPSHPLDVASQWRGDRFGSARPKVIVVSHDASRTGAPVVALNICQQLSARADVIAILLAGGPLVENFRQGCCETLVLEKPEMRHAVVLARLIRDIRERVKVDHAIVNSTESRMMVKPLVDQGVRVLFLVHEYISYLHSRTSTDEAINQASVVVVSSRPVLEDAINDDTRTALERAVLLRQGKSVIPPSEAESAEAAKRLRGIDDREEAPDTVDRVKALLESITPRPRLVLGAGTVQFRKGVDLFFAVGLALRRHAPDDNTLFVWVGHDNESDLSYTACLSMQMRELERAGGNAKLFGVTSRLEELYGLADIFLLPSRMDPLPNVAIDAMTVGLPVLCFEGAGGIPEVLADSAHGEVSVAPFSDVAEVARRLDALAHDSHLRDAVGAENRRIAQDAFDMNAYVERLVALLWAEAPATI
ncbi:glycosyltransferase family 4 protein [Caballeronia calidae]|nr:glycosyltransferase family 4 protein [Caballeronia calidae]